MKKVISSDQAPKALGPYSQAIQFGNLIYTSGQISIDPATASLLGDNIKEQTHRVMANLKAVLHAAGSDFSKVLKTTVFLSDINDFAEFNNVYAEYFPADPPARSTFQVAALPMGAKVEIEVIATS